MDGSQECQVVKFRSGADGILMTMMGLGENHERDSLTSRNVTSFLYISFYFILLQYHEAIGILHFFNSAERYCQSCWREELLNNHLHYKSVQERDCLIDGSDR